MGDHAKPIEDLREVAARLRASELGDAGLRFARGLDAYLEHASAGMTLEAAVGIKVEPGGSPWWVEDARKRRDQLIGEFAVRFCCADTTTARAELRRYEDGAWRRDKRLTAMPSSYSGTPRELLYRAFRVNESIAPGRMPASDKHLGRIIASYCSKSGMPGHEIPPFRVPAMPTTSTSRAKGCDHVAGKNPKITERRRRGGRR